MNGRNYAKMLQVKIELSGKLTHHYGKQAYEGEKYTYKHSRKKRESNR